MMLGAPAAGWFFLVFSMGVHNGHSWVQGRVIDRLVLPTKEACEAARKGMEDYEDAADKVVALYQAGPCQPVERGEKEEK
jgi:hypothetical protein